MNREQLKSAIEEALQRQPVIETPLKLFKSDGFARPAAGPPPVCPACQQPLQPFNYGYNSNIILEHCPGCGGIALHRQQFSQLVDYCRVNPKLQELGQTLAAHQAAVLVSRYGPPSQPREDAPWPAIPRPAMPDLDQVLNRSTLPAVAIALLLVNILVELVANRLRPAGAPPLGPLGIFSGPTLMTDQGWRSFILSFMLHDGYLHLGTNMFMLLIFGPALEEIFGHWHFLYLYFACSAAAAATQAIFLSGGAVPLIGTSGAIIGLIGAYLAINPKAPLPMYYRGKTIQVPVYLLPLIWFGSQLLNFYGLPMIGKGVFLSWWAQAGGLAAGLIYGLLFRWRKLNPSQA